MISLLLYLIFAGVFLVDIILDRQAGVPQIHIIHEFVLFALAMMAAIWQSYLLVKRGKLLSSTLKLYDQALKDHENWKNMSKNSAKEIRGLIDMQLESWTLSASEKDVAILLIKGLTMKEIAQLRGTHEKTVRQQATNIYKKSSLTGRNELSAFFLEDILSTPNHEA